MILLAIDPGTYETAFYDGERRVFKTYRKGWPLSKRLFEFMTDLDYLLASGHYTAVAFEQSFARGDAATRALYGLAGIIMATAEKHECAVLPIKVSDWKGWAGLKRGTKEADDKQPTIELAQVMSGIEGLNEHEADAIVIWNYVTANAKETK